MKSDSLSENSKFFYFLFSHLAQLGISILLEILHDSELQVGLQSGLIMDLKTFHHLLVQQWLYQEGRRRKVTKSIFYQREWMTQHVRNLVAVLWIILMSDECLSSWCLRGVYRVSMVYSNGVCLCGVYLDLSEGRIRTGQVRTCQVRTGKVKNFQLFFFYSKFFWTKICWQNIFFGPKFCWTNLFFY